MSAVEALITAADFSDTVRESQESVELAVKALLELKASPNPRTRPGRGVIDGGARSG